MRELFLLAPMVLAACTVGPDYRKPDMAVPAQFRALQDVSAAAMDWPQWWQGFSDAELQSLIARGLSANLDLKTALSRLEQARAQVVIAGAAAWPQLSASADAARLHANSSPLGALGGSGASAAAPAPSPSKGLDLRLYSLGFDASWEIDVFGGTRRGVESATATADAALWTVRDAEVTLAAEIAADYLALRGTQAQLALLARQSAGQDALLRLVQARARTGFVTELDVRQQDTQAANVVAQIPPLEANARALEHAIAVLLAVPPDALAGELEKAAPLPQGPASLPAALPSDLLRRRPDVRAAERRLAAATADIGVAVADLYPKFNLLAGLSLAGNHFSSLLLPNSLGEFGLGMIQWPLFSAGKGTATVAVKKAARDQAYLAYQKAVLTAIQDSEDALTRCVDDQARLATLARAEASAQAAADAAVAQYRAGLVPYMNVLIAQQSWLAAESQLLAARQQRAVDLISAYKALGGGWNENQDRAVPAVP